MKIEILSTGDELLIGSVTDTNSAWIAQKCIDNGYTILRHTTTGDDFENLVSLFQEMSKRADIVIVSGGLGPTTDDRSAEAAAKAGNTTLSENRVAFQSIEKYFGKSGRSMTSADRKQTLLPETADCIENHAGTAPGFKMRIGDCLFFFIPGVPREMKRMFSHSVLPFIDEISGDGKRRFLRKSLFLFGLPEAIVSEKLKQIHDINPDLIIGFRADFPVIEIKLSQSFREDEEPFNNAVKWAEDQVKGYVFSEDDGRIEAVVGNLLREKGKTISIAESCTGGLIGHKLTAVAGSSDYFLTSCVTYANSAKERIIGVSRETLEQYGAVSAETVKEMAEGVRNISGSDYAVATSGIAGPGGGTPEKPVGLVFIGIAHEGGTEAFEFRSPFGQRGLNKILFYVKSLDLIRRTLLGIPVR